MTNQCLQNPAAEEASSAPDAPAAVGSEKGRVLLLEDDPSFNELITDFLAQNGYSVVPVQNGLDGIQEVIAGDFTLILCDLKMPRLSGEMFYRGVERVRPELCKRLVFMTGHRCDSQTNEFIARVGALVLHKPFRLGDLLDWMAVNEICNTHESVFGHDSGLLAPQEETSQEIDPVAAVAARLEASIREQREAERMASGQTVPAPARPAEIAPAGEAEERPAGGSPGVVFATLAFLFVVSGVCWKWYWHARDRVDSATMEKVALETEWATSSRALEEANVARSGIEAMKDKLARISADRTMPRWTPALRCIVPPGDADIEILRIEARGLKEDAGAGEVRVQGVAGGTPARMAADRYRQAIEDSLRKLVADRPVNIHFEKLEEMPGSLPGKPRAAFVLIVTLGGTNASTAMRKEGN